MKSIFIKIKASETSSLQGKQGEGSKREEFSPQQEQHPAPGASFQCPIPNVLIPIGMLAKVGE